MKFNYKEIKEWPYYSWLVKAEETSRITVFHGSEVEISKHFFCEAVWDGEFSEGEFDNTDVVFGSGARIRGDELFLVSSCSIHDRLHHYIGDDHEVIVSNSLVCLLAFLNEKLDPTYQNYYFDFFSIAKGINNHNEFIRTLSDKKIYLTYHHNLKWDGKVLSKCPKVMKTEDFGTFVKYYDFLCNSIDKIFCNAIDPKRRIVLKKLGTISRGYDSPTVTALTQKYGLKKVIAFEKDRAGRDDCGDDLAKAMNVTVTKVSREAWKWSKLSEIPFIAAEGRGEDVTFSAIPDNIIRNRIFLTGYYGGLVWNKYPDQQELSDELMGASTAGLSLTEYRLWKGFIHVPVPFIGARQIHDINKISHLEEMKPWNVPSHYNRPICRRIVEAFEVPGDAFGQRKQNTTVELSKRWTFISADSQNDFYVWLKDQRHIFKQKKKIFPGRKVRFMVNTYRRILIKSMDIFIKMFFGDSSRIRTYKRSYTYKKLGFDCWFTYLFPWAVERAKKRYKTNSLR